MATDAPMRDRLRVTDERRVELLLGAALTMVAIAAVSWAVDAFYQSGTVATVLYAGGALAGFGLVIAIYRRHLLGLVGGLPYFGAVVGDVLVQWSGFQDPLGLPGAVAFAVLGGGLLLLCRDAFRAGSGPWP